MGDQITYAAAMLSAETVLLENTQIRLAARPHGRPGPEHFAVTREPAPQPGDGQVLIRTRYPSLDPYMRGRMIDILHPPEGGGFQFTRGA